MTCVGLTDMLLDRSAHVLQPSDCTVTCETVMSSEPCAQPVNANLRHMQTAHDPFPARTSTSPQTQSVWRRHTFGRLGCLVLLADGGGWATGAPLPHQSSSAGTGPAPQPPLQQSVQSACIAHHRLELRQQCELAVRLSCRCHRLAESR